MQSGLWDIVRQIAARNLPGRKPQLWENLSLSLRRRLEFEIGRSFRPGWMERPHIVALSAIGLGEDRPPPRIEVRPLETVNRAIFLYGTFEISETRLIQALLRPGMTFLDVGAHIGYYTIIAASLVGDTGRVYSFEPSAGTRQLLDANVKRNGFRNVVIRPEALAHQTGEVGFYPSALASNQGISSIIASGDRGPAVTVPSLTLDDFANAIGNPRIGLIKMDIEGAELHAIRGGQRVLGGAEAPLLIFEAHDLAPVASPLRALGYHLRRLHYTLDRGLELPDVDVPFHGIFDQYEAPNYFAAKDPAVFDEVVARANTRRSPLLRFLGRIGASSPLTN
jgi:FkbM family methyltransferase